MEKNARLEKYVRVLEMIEEFSKRVGVDTKKQNVRKVITNAVNTTRHYVYDEIDLGNPDVTGLMSDYIEGGLEQARKAAYTTGSFPQT